MKENKSYYLKFKIKSSVFPLNNKLKPILKKRKSIRQMLIQSINSFI